jgi:exodeoxyribonuclease VII large subunit
MRTIESALGLVRVRGEISGGNGTRRPCYFTLKDEAACIDAVIWKGQAAGLAFRRKDGARGHRDRQAHDLRRAFQYQIVVNRMELAGEGALMALLDKRRRALAAEGCSTRRKKRRLPFCRA